VFIVTHTKPQLPTRRNHRFTVSQSQLSLKAIGPVVYAKFLATLKHGTLQNSTCQLWHHHSDFLAAENDKKKKSWHHHSEWLAAEKNALIP
jgi:hypothetical protein